MFGFSAVTIAITIAALLAVVGSYFVYHKWRNPVEKEMEEIIKHEVGIDIDNYLPDDGNTVSDNTVEPNASSTENK